jgi:predicted nucleic acid-binding protein
VIVPAYVIDASVGVKWFRDEPGSTRARELVAEHIAGRAVLTVDTLFWHEVLRAASRDGHIDDVMRVWRDLERVDLVIVPLGEVVVEAAAAVREQYGCSLYDAFAPALADLLGTEFFSADRRAHGAHPRARIVGE